MSTLLQQYKARGVLLKPRASGVNTVRSQDPNAVPLTLQGHATQTAELLKLLDGAGSSKFWVGPGGGVFVRGSGSGIVSQFFNGSEPNPRVELGYSGFGSTLGFGPGTSAVDAVLSRLAPEGNANFGTFAQDSRRFDRLGFINVKDFGAKGDGVTDDRIAIQAAIDEAASFSRCPTVFFPAGEYDIDCTTVGLVLPNNKPISLFGDPSNPTTVSLPAVMINRSAGNATLVGNAAGADETERWRGSMQNLRWNGGGGTGRVAFFNRCGDAHWNHCRFGGQSPVAAAPGVEFRSMFNCVAIDCHFLTMGNGTAQPATLITTSTVDPGGTTAGFYLIACEWERNTGTDCHIGGSTFEVHSVFLIGGKMEGNNPATTAPMVRFHDNAHGNRVIGMQLYHTSAAGAASCVVQNGASCNGNGIIGCHLKQTGSTPGTYYLIHQATGSFSANGCFLDNGGNETSAWRMDSAVAAPSGTFNTGGFNPGGAVGGGNTYTTYTQSKRYSDARAGGPFGPQLIA